MTQQQAKDQDDWGGWDAHIQQQLKSLKDRRDRLQEEIDGLQDKLDDLNQDIEDGESFLSDDSDKSEDDSDDMPPQPSSKQRDAQASVTQHQQKAKPKR